MTLEDLKQYLDQTVLLRMLDGEIAKVRILLVDQEYNDLIVDVLETSAPQRYRNLTAAHAFAASDIASAELAE